jgi:hypothetical protein
MLVVFSIYWGLLQLRTDDERLNWQLDFGSKLIIVSLLCLTMALYTIYYLDIVEVICFFFNRIISIHTTTSVSRRLKILCIMFKIIAFFVIVLFAWLYVEPIPNSNIKIIEKGQINTHNILIHDRSLSWLITVPSMKLEGSLF